MIRSKNTGQIIVISAPSGAGKGTIIKRLLENNPKDRWLSVSATSRKPRVGEKEGINYYYITEEEFQKRIKEDYFLEYTNYAGNYYGTPREKKKKKISNGIDVFLEIEIEGANNIKKLIPEALFIFIMPPSLKELVKRLKGRGTETNEKIIKRFNAAYKEVNEVTKYNYVVVNDEIEIAVDKIESIIKAERCRVDRIEEVYLDTKEEEVHELLINEDFDNSGLGDKIWKSK